MAWRWVAVALTVLLAAACTSNADVDTAAADSTCQRVDAELEDLARQARTLEFDATSMAGLDSLAAEIDGTDVAELIDSMSSALLDLYSVPPGTDRQTWQIFGLEARRAVSEVGLWCLRNTSSAVADEIGPAFFRST